MRKRRNLLQLLRKVFIVTAKKNQAIRPIER